MAGWTTYIHYCVLFALKQKMEHYGMGHYVTVDLLGCMQHERTQVLKAD